MGKRKYVRDLVIGEAMEGENFVLKSMADKPKDGRIAVTLSDKTGCVEGRIPPQVSDLAWLKDHVNMVLNVKAIVLCEGKTPFLLIKEATEESDFKPCELYQGLKPEKVKQYIEDIEELKGYVKHPGYRALLDAALTKENLEEMGLTPATLNFYGRYAGGALAATDSITRMVAQSMQSYTRRSNGLTNRNPSWDVLLTACLLHQFGRLTYFDETHFKRSELGVALGYFPTLQTALQDVIRENAVPLTKQEIANLLNILDCSVSSKTETKAVSKEGPILRSMIRMYAECDSIDWEAANHEPAENEGAYYYNPKLNRYVMEV